MTSAVISFIFKVFGVALSCEVPVPPLFKITSKASLNDSALKSFYKSSKASGKMSYESFKSEITTQANEVVKSSTAAKVRIIIITIIKGDKIIIVVRR